MADRLAAPRSEEEALFVKSKETDFCLCAEISCGRGPLLSSQHPHTLLTCLSLAHSHTGQVTGWRMAAGPGLFPRRSSDSEVKPMTPHVCTYEVKGISARGGAVWPQHQNWGQRLRPGSQLFLLWAELGRSCY